MGLAAHWEAGFSAYRRPKKLRAERDPRASQARASCGRIRWSSRRSTRRCRRRRCCICRTVSRAPGSCRTAASSRSRLRACSSRRRRVASRVASASASHRAGSSAISVRSIARSAESASGPSAWSTVPTIAPGSSAWSPRCTERDVEGVVDHEHRTTGPGADRGTVDHPTTRVVDPHGPLVARRRDTRRERLVRVSVQEDQLARPRRVLDLEVPDFEVPDFEVLGEGAVDESHHAGGGVGRVGRVGAQLVFLHAVEQPQGDDPRDRAAELLHDLRSLAALRRCRQLAGEERSPGIGVEEVVGTADALADRTLAAETRPHEVDPGAVVAFEVPGSELVDRRAEHRVGESGHRHVDALGEVAVVEREHPAPDTGGRARGGDHDLEIGMGGVAVAQHPGEQVRLHRLAARAEGTEDRGDRLGDGQWGVAGDPLDLTRLDLVARHAPHVVVVVAREEHDSTAPRAHRHRAGTAASRTGRTRRARRGSAPSRVRARHR